MEKFNLPSIHKMNKKGGMVVPIILGIAFLITTSIIAFVVVSNVAVVENDMASYSTQYVVNESGRANNTAYTVTKAGIPTFTNAVLLKVYNNTASAVPLIMNLANFSMTSAGVIRNTSATGGVQCHDCLLTYSYQIKETTISSDDLRYNFTEGVGKVANKVPTILLIIAVVIILGVLTLLWQQYQKMNVGGGGQL